MNSGIKSLNQNKMSIFLQLEEFLGTRGPREFLGAINERIKPQKKRARRVQTKALFSKSYFRAFPLCIHSNDTTMIVSTQIGFLQNANYTFFIGNTIFHLSLELVTKFWKTSLEKLLNGCLVL